MYSKNIYVKNCCFGKGIFAIRNFKKGEKILDFTGPIINQSKAHLSPPGNPLQVSQDEYIDLLEPAVLVNHSCKPNAGISNNTELIAIRNISKDEEIFYDYSTTMDEDYWTLECKCGEQDCRKIIKDFKYLPIDLQRKYLKLGIVQSFIAKQVFVQHSYEELAHEHAAFSLQASSNR